jgi:hypothetical protein
MAGTLTSIRLVSGDVEQDPSSAGAGNREQGSGVRDRLGGVRFVAGEAGIEAGSRVARRICRAAGFGLELL